jgi:poly(A) polymerase
VLLDPHGGQADLALRQLRLLHSRSLENDPTRLVRAARYSARLGFALAPESFQQAAATLAAWPWAWRPGGDPALAPPALGTRLRMELELLLEREPWRQALAALQAWGGLALLDAQLQADRHWRRRLAWAQRLGLPLLAALVAGAADPLALAERLQLPHRQHKLLAQLLELRRRLAASSPGCPSAWCALLEAPGLSPEAVALALAAGNGPRRPLLHWWARWRHLPAPLSAAELMAREGLKPGPGLGERLRQLRAERLDQLA